jgi:hypothetical protein
MIDEYNKLNILNVIEEVSKINSIDANILISILQSQGEIIE